MKQVQESPGLTLNYICLCFLYVCVFPVTDRKHVTSVRAMHIKVFLPVPYCHHTRSTQMPKMLFLSHGPKSTLYNMRIQFQKGQVITTQPTTDVDPLSTATCPQRNSGTREAVIVVAVRVVSNWQQQTNALAYANLVQFGHATVSVLIVLRNKWTVLNKCGVWVLQIELST